MSPQRIAHGTGPMYTANGGGLGCSGNWCWARIVYCVLRARFSDDLEIELSMVLGCPWPTDRELGGEHGRQDSG